MNPKDRCFDGLARNLIQHAARKTPPLLSERLGEEWLADLTARAGAFSQLRFALGCYWATAVIAHEFGAPLRATAAALGSKTSVVDRSGPGESFSRRTMVILLIVAFHVVVICILATAIEAPRFFKPIPPKTAVTFLPRPTHPLPATPANPTFVDFAIDLPNPPPPTEQAATTPERVAEAPAAQSVGPLLPNPVTRVLGGPGAGFPNTDDFYPQASIRAHEWGIAIVGVCVDGAGRLTGKPAINQSSGSARLDEAALRLAQAGSGHYRATTEDGRPVGACYPFRVRFQLRD